MLENICMLYRNVLLWFPTAWQYYHFKFFINLPSSRGTGKVPVHNDMMFKSEASATGFLHSALQTWGFSSLNSTYTTPILCPFLISAWWSIICNSCLSSTSSRFWCFPQITSSNFRPEFRMRCKMIKLQCLGANCKIDSAWESSPWLLGWDLI